MNDSKPSDCPNQDYCARYRKLVGNNAKYRAELEDVVRHCAERIHNQRVEINRLLAEIATLRGE